MISSSDGDELVFHPSLGGVIGPPSLGVSDGLVDRYASGCTQSVETRLEGLPSGYAAVTAGPWWEPLTPRDEAVRVLVAPFLGAIEGGDTSVLVEATEQDFLAHGCRTSRDAVESLEGFVAQEPELVGIYEPPKRGWLSEWWLVFRLADGNHVRLTLDQRPRVVSLFAPCEGDLERVTEDGAGTVPLLWAPEASGG